MSLTQHSEISRLSTASIWQQQSSAQGGSGHRDTRAWGISGIRYLDVYSFLHDHNLRLIHSSDSSRITPRLDPHRPLPTLRLRILFGRRGGRGRGRGRSQISRAPRHAPTFGEILFGVCGQDEGVAGERSLWRSCRRWGGCVGRCRIKGVLGRRQCGARGGWRRAGFALGFSSN